MRRSLMQGHAQKEDPTYPTFTATAIGSGAPSLGTRTLRTLYELPIESAGGKLCAAQCSSLTNCQTPQEKRQKVHRNHHGRLFTIRVFEIVYVYIYIYIYTPYVYIYTHVCVLMYVYVCIHIYTYMHTYIYVYMYMYSNILYVYLRIRIHVHMCIHIYMHTYMDISEPALANCANLEAKCLGPPPSVCRFSAETLGGPPAWAEGFCGPTRLQSHKNP